MYSGIGVILAKSRGAEDELNTIVAGTTTGLLYKSSGNLALYFVEGRSIFSGCVLVEIQCALRSSQN